MQLRQMYRAIRPPIDADAKEVGKVAFNCYGQLGLRLKLVNNLVVTVCLSQRTICPWYVYAHRAVWYCTPNTVPPGANALRHTCY